MSRTHANVLVFAAGFISWQLVVVNWHLRRIHTELERNRREDEPRVPKATFPWRSP